MAPFERIPVAPFVQPTAFEDRLQSKQPATTLACDVLVFVGRVAVHGQPLIDEANISLIDSIK